MKAKRYNKGKLRYELLPFNALENVVEVYTKGAHKYSLYRDEGGNTIKGSDIPFEEVQYRNLTVIEDGANNWRLGQNWSGSMASIKRHISEWEKGNDIDLDPSMGTYHLANAAWGLLSLLEYYKIYPQGDDRQHSYLNSNKIGLDIDEVLADFVGGMMRKFPEMDKRSIYWNDHFIHKNFKEIIEDEDFWMNLDTIVDELPFEPHCYITSRPVPTELTKKWLDKNGFPAAPVYTVGSGESKLDVAIQTGIDIFVDDAYHNFVELNKGGVCCFLMDASHNKRYDVGFKRIKSLSELI